MADATQNPQGGGAQPPLQVKVPDDVQKGTYSNAVSVNVNSNEVVLDFGYLLPNTPSPIIEVVSRVNMNQRTAESFLNVLQGAMEDFKKKQAAMNAQQATAQQAPAPMAQPMQPQQPMQQMQQPPMAQPMQPQPMQQPMGGQMPQPPMAPYPENS